jgi:hypothetical protein
VFGATLGQILATLVNIIAIVTYLDFARSDRKGFMRFLAFWLGFPVTFFLKVFVNPDPVLVAERKLAARLPPAELDVGVPEYVRKEIRAIREARLGGEAGESPPPD